MYDASLDVFGKLNWVKDFYLNYMPIDFSYIRKFSVNSTSYSVNKMKKYNQSVLFMPFSRIKPVLYDTSFHEQYLMDEEMEEALFCLMESPREKEAANLPPDKILDIEYRNNFNETVFFLPNLVTNDNGEVSFKFKMNDALTRWRLMIYAHTKDLQFGYTENEVVTQKELMILPNIPRFVREGDEITITSKVVNFIDQDINGEVELKFYDTKTRQEVNPILQVEQNVYSFEIPAKQSAVFKWKIKIPVNILSGLTYRIFAKSSQFSDGEEGAFPVLSQRVLLTESMPIQVNKQSKSTFQFDRFANTKSETLENYKLTFEFTQNPIWNAIQALPYLMEFPHECNEQLVNRLYANVLATDIINKYPEIKKVFNRWGNSNALISNLNKNKELKSILLEETPWILESKNEEEQKKNIALLFDLNKISKECDQTILKIEQQQNRDGSFSWFPGGTPNRYITQYMIEGISRIKLIYKGKLPGKLSSILSNAISYSDNLMYDDCQELKKEAKAGRVDMNEYVPSNEEIHYLYVRSLFLKENKLYPTKVEEYNYLLNQANKNWTQKDIYIKAMIAITLHKNGRQSDAEIIMASLKDYAVINEKEGMYWKYLRGSEWNQHYIETHVLLLEAYRDILKDNVSVENMKIWLLINKQTSHWKTTKATAAAIHALITSDANWVSENKPVKMEVGNEKIIPEKFNAEAGSGYIKVSWTGDEITKDKANVNIKNSNTYPVWGAMYWQYFENLDRVEMSDNEEMTIKRNLFLVSDEGSENKYIPVSDTTHLTPGNLILVQIELKINRDMDFIHMKDMRGACLEPVNVLSGYKWGNGIRYYESPRDASTNFFFDRITKGEYVIEYLLRVNQTGDFSNGISTIENMYAPEFRAQSKGCRIKSVN